MVTYLEKGGPLGPSATVSIVSFHHFTIYNHQKGSNRANGVHHSYEDGINFKNLLYYQTLIPENCHLALHILKNFP